MPAGHRLIDLINETALIPDAGDPGCAPGCNAVTELCLQHVPEARHIAGQFRSSVPPQVYRWGAMPARDVQSLRGKVKACWAEACFELGAGGQG